MTFCSKFPQFFHFLFIPFHLFAILNNAFQGPKFRVPWDVLCHVIKIFADLYFTYNFSSFMYNIDFYVQDFNFWKVRWPLHALFFSYLYLFISFSYLYWFISFNLRIILSMWGPDPIFDSLRPHGPIPQF